MLANCFRKKHVSTSLGSILLFLFCSCSTTKYVPDGSYLLDKTSIEVEGKVVNSSDLQQYLRQRPNFKAFGLFRLYLGVYNFSGRDTSKKINKKLRQIGESPVLYDPFLTFQSEKELQKYMKTKGYMNASVTSEAIVREKKKMHVSYTITPNEPYNIRTVENNFEIEPLIDSLLSSNNNGYARTLLKEGGLFDIDILDAERERISTFLRRRGFYNFNKEYLTFTADTSVGNHKVDVKMIMKPYVEILPDGTEITKHHQQYAIRNINITTYNKSTTNASNAGDLDTIVYNDRITIYSNGKPLIKPKILVQDLRITPDVRYSDFLVERTYSRFNTFDILRATTIRFNDPHNGKQELDCDISLYSAKPQSVSFDIEGTNSDGDLGFATNVGYAHKNIFRGSETLGVKAKYAQEAYSGFSDMKDSAKFVLDLGGDLSLSFPRFIFPFLSNTFRRRIDASTEFKIGYNRQIRPNTYKRNSISAGMKYMWNYRRNYRYTVDLIDINYIDITTSARFDSIYSGDRYSVLRESYSDHFIMSIGGSIIYNNQLQKTKKNKTLYKASFETAGNLLYGISSIANRSKNEMNGQYEVWGIPYSQYVKGEFDYSFNHEIDEKNHIVYHIGFGLAYPYGNADIVPFEKRFFGGGANGVRGWSVRTLGPGIYSSAGINDFVKQTGDFKLLMNMEYRTKLFWKIEAAAFVDAGNIWTIKEYESQPGGRFSFEQFYKQIALAYGLGLRFDFSYFLIRFDVGVKAYDPSRFNAIAKDGSRDERWRFHGLNWSDDCTFHFAIGYPF